LVEHVEDATQLVLYSPNKYFILSLHAFVTSHRPNYYTTSEPNCR